MSSIIQMDGVQKSYFLSNGEKIPVLRGIDLEIQENEFVVLMGESGSGKSTLLNIIGCLHSVDSGKYVLGGQDITSLRDDTSLATIRNKMMGFIFQQFHLIQKMTALKNVALPGFYNGMSVSQRESKARQILTEIGLSDRMGHKPSELSGGQQQRVSIARALLNDPEIILADEPTGALDSKTGIEVMELFTEFRKRGKTIIMVTHTPEVAKYADRIIFLKDGKVVNHNYYHVSP